MGFERLFLFQGKKREEENSRQYESWAFPYGSAQKEKIRKLLQQAAALAAKRESI